MGVAYKPSSILHTVVCSNSQLYVSEQCLFRKSWFTIFNEIIFANSWKFAKLVKLKTRESLVLYSILSLMEPKWPMCRQSIVCHVFDNVSPSTHCNTAVTCGTMLLPRPFSDLCCACTWTFRVLNTLLAQLINYKIWFIAIYFYPTDEEKQTLYHNCLYGESWSLYSFCPQFYHHNIHWLLSLAKSVTSMNYSRHI